ncbi:MAG: hypothetical protein E7J79_04430 [Aggregatibacter aphrophilus]|jgi:lipoprotein|uniref:hypothetical protein n=1 Tax=Aggregatibacter aphrophilus TaxID=732 RepID=UPI000D6E5E02|nr:hypothetical protein [Aggregatibacter aphrophilus]MDU7785538.1 hypothetical protein [Aggregatibacter aphrophilus]
MKNIFIASLVSIVLAGCVGGSPDELRSQDALSYPSKNSKDDAKLCLLNKLDKFRPDRLAVNDFSDRAEVFIGAIQMGKLRNYYLFVIKDKEIKLSKYDGYYLPLSLDEAKQYVEVCSQ